MAFRAGSSSHARAARRRPPRPCLRRYTPYSSRRIPMRVIELCIDSCQRDGLDIQVSGSSLAGGRDQACRFKVTGRLVTVDVYRTRRSHIHRRRDGQAPAPDCPEQCSQRERPAGRHGGPPVNVLRAPRSRRTCSSRRARRVALRLMIFLSRMHVGVRFRKVPTRRRASISASRNRLELLVHGKRIGRRGTSALCAVGDVVRRFARKPLAAGV